MFVKLGKSVYNTDHITRICPAFASQVGVESGAGCMSVKSLHDGYYVSPRVTAFVKSHFSLDELRNLGFHIERKDKFVRTPNRETAMNEVALDPVHRQLACIPGLNPGYYLLVDSPEAPEELSIHKIINGEKVEDAHYHLPLENYGKIVAYYVCTDEVLRGLNGGAYDVLVTKEEGIELMRKLGINMEED